jgi:hypothetical protein
MAQRAVDLRIPAASRSYVERHFSMARMTRHEARTCVHERVGADQPAGAEMPTPDLVEGQSRRYEAGSIADGIWVDDHYYIWRPPRGRARSAVLKW